MGTSPAYALRRATSRDDWVLVRALRCAARTGRGDVATFGASEDRRDAAPGSATFLLTCDGRAVGTTRSSHARAGEPAPLAALEAFAADLEPGFGRASVVEASLTRVDPAFADPALAVVRLFKAHSVAGAATPRVLVGLRCRERAAGIFRRLPPVAFDAAAGQ